MVTICALVGTCALISGALGTYGVLSAVLGDAFLPAIPGLQVPTEQPTVLPTEQPTAMPEPTALPTQECPEPPEWGGEVLGGEDSGQALLQGWRYEGAFTIIHNKEHTLGGYQLEGRLSGYSSGRAILICSDCGDISPGVTVSTQLIFLKLSRQGLPVFSVVHWTEVPDGKTT
jgi:hypothetical protein